MKELHDTIFPDEAGVNGRGCVSHPGWHPRLSGGHQAPALRLAGGAIYADLRHVPSQVAQAIRTRVRRIGTSVHNNGGLRAVEFFTKTPVREFGSSTAEALQVDSLDGSVLHMGTIVDEEWDDEGATVRQQEDPTMPMRYEDLPVEDQCDLTRQVVDHRVRTYMNTHAGTGYAEALAATLQADPLLKQRYAASWIPLPAGDAPNADWHEAGLEILREADRYQQEHPELSREEAIHAVFRNQDNAALIRRYLLGSTPPGA
jgi:hypothetical protein